MSIQKHVKSVVDEWLDAPRLTREYVAEQLGHPLNGSRCVIDGRSIISEVRERTAFSGKCPFDSTILRRLRELRKLGYRITCINTHKSIYALEGKCK